ncbi:hypothetical protein P886_5058 [Alteromonadaceae bacterium 2753L.S.0a.02]|nr:hypothetical protein P886_5058 [Alteromonadaceae bacterium 2753L.S.0a.02]
MTRPRKEQVCLNDTPYYHIVSRCVRRTFLCGTDSLTGKNYEHRRQWIEDRIRILSSIFGVDICAYGVMSNHIHLVVKLSPDSINTLDHKEILERWTSLFKGPLLVQKWRSGETLDTAQRDAVTACIDVYRVSAKPTTPCKLGARRDTLKPPFTPGGFHVQTWHLQLAATLY